jgi:hypothetical protein
MLRDRHSPQLTDYAAPARPLAVNRGNPKVLVTVVFSLSSIRMEERDGERRAVITGFLLSPALSSLVPREEREKTKCCVAIP